VDRMALKHEYLRQLIDYRLSNLTESQKPNMVYFSIHQLQSVVFRPILIRIGDRNGRGIKRGE
jgi:hypothetical protein